MSQNKTRGPTAPFSNASICTDHYDHFPVYSSKQGRYRKSDCQGYTFVKCSKCDARLCITSSFKEFHDSHFFHWRYWWTILIADSLEPYIKLYRPLFFADFNILLRCIIPISLHRKSLVIHYCLLTICFWVKSQIE